MRKRIPVIRRACGVSPQNTQKRNHPQVAAITEPATVVDPVRHGIDRMVRNVETGRFERSLSALTAAGALVTAAEIYFEHDSASFGNKMMWLPVVLCLLYTSDA